MISEKVKTFFGNVKDRLKPEDIDKFTANEQIIKDAFDEFSQSEKVELIKELKELSESQFEEISENVGVSVEYLKDIQKFTLYTIKELYYHKKEFERKLLYDWDAYEARRRRNNKIILTIILLIVFILIIIWKLYGVL